MTLPSISKRITYNIPIPPKKYDGFLFHIELWDKDKRWIDENGKKQKGLLMHYGGKRMERHKNGYSDVYSYLGTLEEPEKTYILRLFAESEKVIHSVIQYDDKASIGSGESKMLREVESIDAKGKKVKGADKAVDWINQTLGGGHYTQGFTGTWKAHGLFERVMAQVNSGKDKDGNYLLIGEFSTKEYSKHEIRQMLHPSNLIQPRDEMVDYYFVDNYVWSINQDNNPKIYPPMILIMPKDPNDLPQIISGHHMGTSVVEAEKGLGLIGIQVPYDVWKILETKNRSDIFKKAFGKYFNPDIGATEHLRKPETPESAAQFIVDLCDQENLYHDVKNAKGKTITVQNYKHNACVSWLNQMKFNPPRQKTVFNKAQILVENEQLRMLGDLLMNWSEDGLKHNPELKAEYDARVKSYIEGMEVDGILEKGVDWVYKISSRNFNLDKIQSHIWRNGYSKRGIVFVFFPTLEDETDWEKSIPHPNTGLISNSIKWEKDKEEFFNKYEIETKRLPVKKSQAIIEGWKSVSKKSAK